VLDALSSISTTLGLTAIVPIARRVPARPAGASIGRNFLKLADEFGRAGRCGRNGREEARYEGPEIGEPVASRLEHNDGNRERDNVLLEGQVSIHRYEYIERR
jgi:hypothetical protein